MQYYIGTAFHKFIIDFRYQSGVLGYTEGYQQGGGGYRNGGGHRNGGYQNGAFQNGGYQNGGYQNGGYQNEDYPVGGEDFVLGGHHQSFSGRSLGHLGPSQAYSPSHINGSLAVTKFTGQDSANLKR